MRRLREVAREARERMRAAPPEERGRIRSHYRGVLSSYLAVLRCHLGPRYEILRRKSEDIREAEAMLRELEG